MVVSRSCTSLRHLSNQTVDMTKPWADQPFNLVPTPTGEEINGVGSLEVFLLGKLI